MVFVLAAEVLTQMTLKAQSVGLHNGFRVNPLGAGFPILQFANDTLFLASGDLKEVKIVRNILIWFKACTGLKVNTSKSVLFSS